MDTIDIRLADLTGRARIRHAALRLFGADGYAQTSLRSIAQTAGVSLALIAHHFGSKHQLRDATDAWVVGAFDQVAHEIEASHGERSSEERCRAFADAIGELLNGQPEMRAYLRRMIVVDGGPNGTALLASLLAIARGVFTRAPNHEADPAHRSLQWMLLMLGPSLLEPVLARCVPGLFAAPRPVRLDAVARPRAAERPAVSAAGEARALRLVASTAERWRH